MSRRKLRPPTQQQERFFREQHFETRRMSLAKSLKRFRRSSRYFALASMALLASEAVASVTPEHEWCQAVVWIAFYAWVTHFALWVMAGLFFLSDWRDLRKDPPGLMEESLRTLARLY